MFLFLTCKCPYQILITYPLTDVCFVVVFSQLVACHFFLLKRSFMRHVNCRKLNLMISNFSKVQIINCLDHILCIISQNIYINPRSQRFSYILSSRSFIVVHFTLKSLNHFNLSSCYKFCM